MTALSRRLATAGAGAAVTVLAVLGLAAPAAAHDVIVGSTPSEGETLTALPARFSITANATLVDPLGLGSGFVMEVRDESGRFYGDGCVTLDGATMSTSAALGQAGAYTLAVNFISSDEHSVNREIPFTWAPPAGAVPSESSTTPPVCGEAGAPEPEVTAFAPEPEPEPNESAGASTGSGSDAGDPSALLWLGGAGLAIVLAIGATVLLVRPRKTS